MQKKFVSTLPVFVATALAAANLAAAQQSGNGNCQGNDPKCRPAKAFNQGEELAAGQLPAAYNAPARIDVRGSWDLFADASYILWQPTQDNMEFAAVAPNGSSVTGDSTGKSTVYTLNPTFKSGFKVGAGVNFDHDNWTNWAEYTWFRSTTTRSVSDLTNGLVAAMLLHPSDQNHAYRSASAKWKVRMDLVDWALGRAAYVGTSLTMLPYMGARAAFIRQSYALDYVRHSNLVQASAEYVQHSWGVGLEAGLRTNWLLGMGFRMFNEIEADLCFTRYKTSAQTFNPDVPSTQTINTSESQIDTVRPHLDLEFGFGYGTYFDNQNWHIDLALGYGFQVFWDQNMFTRFVDDVARFASLRDIGNLYTQGMTFTARVDF